VNGNKVALDTNVTIAVLNDTQGAGAWVRGFEQVYLPVPVVGELIFGALNSQRPQHNSARVQELISRCAVLEVRVSTASIYAQTRVQLKRKGKPIPENDLWIAALCLEHGIPLATEDAHFSEISGLTVERR
jgi:tRNA(fMet)-specific endonuclease VapC